MGVSANCRRIRLKRLGEQKIVVSGKGVSAVLVVTGIPQQQWMKASPDSGGSFGAGTTVAVTTPSGRGLSWGSNSYGPLGRNSAATTLEFPIAPVTLLGENGRSIFTGLSQISTGESASLALTKAGTVFSWGNGTSRQLGQPGVGGDTLTPVRVQDYTRKGQLDRVVQVAIGDSHAAALLDGGHVVSWGDFMCVVGATGPTYDALPLRVAGPDGKSLLSGIVAVASGNVHTFALSAEGQVYAWGFDISQGVLGAGKVLPNPVYRPILVRRSNGKPLSDIVAISAGYNIGLALAADGTVWAWGSNLHGQLGRPSSNNEVPYARQVAGPSGSGTLRNIVMVAAGGWHALALDNKGQVYAWGLAYDGQLGDGPSKLAGNESELPRLVLDEIGDSPLTDIVSIATAYTQSFALKADGTVLSWGDNFRGALGRATTTAAGEHTPGPVTLADGSSVLKLKLSAYPNLQQRSR